MASGKHQQLLDKKATTTVPRVGVIGAGYWGKNLVRSFAALGALETVTDTDTATVEKMIDAHGGRNATLENVLKDKAIAAVAIAAPASAHFMLAKRALEAGKHVFVEKPVALDLKSAEELCLLSERSNLRLMVGHLLQYHPAFIALKAIVTNGGLGDLQYLYSNRLNFGLIRHEEDVLWSFAPHDISMILSLTGSEPSAVEAVGANYLQPTIADTTTTHLKFSGGQAAHVFVSWLHPFKEQKLVVIGRDAMAVFDDGEAWERKLIIYPHKMDKTQGIPKALKAQAEPYPLVAAEPLNNECRHFLESVANGTPPRTDGREGLRVLSVLARASASLARGRGMPEKKAI